VLNSHLAFTARNPVLAMSQTGADVSSLRSMEGPICGLRHFYTTLFIVFPFFFFLSLCCFLTAFRFSWPYRKKREETQSSGRSPSIEWHLHSPVFSLMIPRGSPLSFPQKELTTFCRFPANPVNGRACHNVRVACFSSIFNLQQPRVFFLVLMLQKAFFLLFYPMLRDS